MTNNQNRTLYKSWIIVYYCKNSVMAGKSVSVLTNWATRQVPLPRPVSSVYTECRGVARILYWGTQKLSVEAVFSAEKYTGGHAPPSTIGGACTPGYAPEGMFMLENKSYMQ